MPASPHAAGHLTQRGLTFDAQLVRLATRQHGVFALGQACALGVSDAAIRQRAAAHRLHRIHQGVYALVPRRLLSREGRWLAAVLACGDGAALSHRSAAHLHELRATSRAGIDVIVAGRTAHRHPGIDLHRSLHLDPAADITHVRGIPTTTIARTLLDYAAVATKHQLARALHQADLQQILDVAAIRAQCRRNPRAPGTRRLSAKFAFPDELSDSPLEDRFIAAWRAFGGPEPEREPYIDPGDGGILLRPDFVWRDSMVAVEIDGRGPHSTRHAFEADRRRDQRLQAAGWVVIRITGRQLTEELPRLLRLIANLIVRRRP